MNADTTYHGAESVTAGHPDKICDQIADAIVDAYLAQDPLSRVACEVLVGKNLVVVAGEITSQTSVSIEEIVRTTLREIGYTQENIGLNWETAQVLTSISEQSPSIRDSINISVEAKEGKVPERYDSLGAGDQALVVGYASNETDVLMPLPIMLANRLVARLDQVRQDGIIRYLRPDGKSMVVIEYRNRQPSRVAAVVLSAQHDPDIAQGELASEVYRYVVEATLPQYLLDGQTRYFFNASGPWSFGGPGADTGLTGRKLAADTYGTAAHTGGGALSGKDPTKIDRSGSYMARHMAKNVIAAGLADCVEVEIGYVIGLARPIHIAVDTFGTEHAHIAKIEGFIRDHFDLRLAGIIDMLALQRPIYRKTATYGHFGRTDIDAPWEAIQ